jgi:hypothetical protein
MLELVCAIIMGHMDCLMILSLTEEDLHHFCSPLVTHGIHMSFFLQSAEQRQDIDIGCNHLMMVA